MVKIKINLFESIVGAIFLPNIGLFFTTVLLVVSMIVKQEPIVYTILLVSYVVCLFVMFFTVAVCFLASKKSNKEFVLKNDEIEFLARRFKTDQVCYCEYHKCRWYAIPIAFIYKQQVAGLITFEFNSGEKNSI